MLARRPPPKLFLTLAALGNTMCLGFHSDRVEGTTLVHVLKAADSLDSIFSHSKMSFSSLFCINTRYPLRSLSRILPRSPLLKIGEARIN